MHHDRKLHDTLPLQQLGWDTAARCMLEQKESPTRYYASYGEMLLTQIDQGVITVSELKEGISWASAHFREAMARLSFDWNSEQVEDRYEATARKIALGAGTYALVRCRIESRTLQD